MLSKEIKGNDYVNNLNFYSYNLFFSTILYKPDWKSNILDDL